MPKSGSKAKSAKSQKTKKPIAICPPKAPAGFLLSSPPEEGTALLSPAEARVLRALHKYGISVADFEDSPQISGIIWRTFDTHKVAVEMLHF